ncbi:hypothetical protein EUGRSUZ_E02123 [Eucalyptus grandis]|uniref:Uncharacterized protein n=2 Tax=Eucalyptus grandis TaxID=71139 RepID=A0ACC3KVY1_EUCGR|nr:hypothetical protein EUGRSUZ_E02123 [Eucalyptus grandis]
MIKYGPERVVDSAITEAGFAGVEVNAACYGLRLVMYFTILLRVNVQSLADGYQGDFVGEATPDVLISEFMKGEKELIQKILETEINIYRAIRDGSALMQHMEDFYYITLLESVRSNYQTVERLQTSDEATDRQLNA